MDTVGVQHLAGRGIDNDACQRQVGVFKDSLWTVEHDTHLIVLTWFDILRKQTVYAVERVAGNTARHMAIFNRRVLALCAECAARTPFSVDGIFHIVVVVVLTSGNTLLQGHDKYVVVDTGTLYTERDGRLHLDVEGRSADACLVDRDRRHGRNIEFLDDMVGPGFVAA